MRQATLAFGKSPLAVPRMEAIELLSSRDEEATADVAGKVAQQNRSLPPRKRIASPLQPDRAKKANTFPSKGSVANKYDEKHTGAVFGGKGDICHHHQAACQDTLLQCTAWKAGGSRCALKYCASALEYTYEQSISYILLRGHSDAHKGGKEHVLELDYMWACPRCTGHCVCSRCAPEKSKESMSSWPHMPVTPARSSEQDWMPSISRKKALSDESSLKEARASNADSAVQASKTLQPTILNLLLRPSQPASAAASTSSSTLFDSVSACQTLRSSNCLSQQKKIMQPLVKPRAVEVALLSRMETRLPLPNIKERIFLYEALVRFDIFDAPERILQKLDRLDDWTEGDVHAIFVKLACFLANVKSVEQNPVRTTYRPLIAALRNEGSDLTQGNAWTWAKQHCESRGVHLSILKDVLLRADQMDSAADGYLAFDPDRTDTLLNSRATRTRRAANTAAIARVKTLTLDGMGGSGDDDDDSDSEEQDRAQTRRRDQVCKPLARPTRYGRDKGDSPRQLLRAEASRRSARRAAQMANETSSEESGESDDHMEREESVSDRSSDVVEVSKPTAVPPFEQRLAILSGLVVLALQTQEVSQEIQESARRIQEREKLGKEEERELRRKQEDEMRQLQHKRMDMHRVGKGKEWKEDMDKLARRQTYNMIDLHMDIHLLVEANKTRSGPLGVDVDGNEFWQLTEFNERMPADTTGHWSWCLLILGTSASIPHSTEGAEAQNKPSDREIDSYDGHKLETATSSSGESVRGLRAFYGVHSVEGINEVIAFVRYRRDLLVYEEKVLGCVKDKEFLKRELEISNATAQIPSRSSVQQPPSQDERARQLGTLQRERTRETKAMAAMQKSRHDQTEALVQRLVAVRKYYEWHAYQKR